MCNNHLPKLGLKLWSTNINLENACAEFFGKQLFDYIELYIVPNSQHKCISRWKGRPWTYVLHAPHSYSGLNMSLSKCERRNRSLIDETDQFRSALKPGNVIFHPGINGNIHETIRQLLILKAEYPDLFDLALIENKPRIGLKGETCIGSSPEEIKRIIGETGIGFCLDVGHAINYSVWANLKYDEVLDKFLSFNPKIYHLSDGDDTSEKDSHLNFGKGNYNLEAILKKLPPQATVTIETDKHIEEKLQDFYKDVLYLKSILSS